MSSQTRIIRRWEAGKGEWPRAGRTLAGVLIAAWFILFFGVLYAYWPGARQGLYPAVPPGHDALPAKDCAGNTIGHAHVYMSGSSDWPESGDWFGNGWYRRPA